MPPQEKPMWTLEIIDVRTDAGARTGKGASFTEEAKARAAFEQVRALDLDVATAPFLLDFHAPGGEILGTTGLDVGGFTALTGEVPDSAEAYTAKDRAYWDAALAARGL